MLGCVPHAVLQPGAISYNAAFRAPCGFDPLALGRMPCASLQPNTVSYNAAISAHEKASRWRAALRLLGCIPPCWIAA
eukprot:10745765-Lingulodinium_polyedra.AAC.1